MSKVRSRLLAILLSGALSALGNGPAVLAHTAPLSVGVDTDQTIPAMGDGQSVLPANEGKSVLAQDPAWLQLKTAHRLMRQPSTGAPMVTASAPAALSAWSIDNPSVRAVLEPGASGTDDAGHAFSDQDYWHFCSAGASDIALYFWNGKTTTFATRTYNEPYGPEHGKSSATSTWTSSDHGRSYLMFLAEAVKPPSFSTPGMVDFTTYPSGGTATQDMRDSLNWEASGENPSDWAQYFYAWVKNDGTITTAGLHADIVGDTFGASGDGVPLIAQVWTGDLPNWTIFGLKAVHSIAIVGYNDSVSQYEYLDTCGYSTRCGSNQDQGPYYISQAGLYAAITDTHMTRGQFGYVW